MLDGPIFYQSTALDSRKALNFAAGMKKLSIILLVFLLLSTTLPVALQAQCSLCAKTAQQMGDKPARGLNSGILYLMIMPFAIVGFIGFYWWKNNKEVEAGQ